MINLNKMTPAAAHDLDDIYYGVNNNLSAPQTADDLLYEIETAVLSLRGFPHRWQYSNNEILRHRGYRRLIIHKYVLLPGL